VVSRHFDDLDAVLEFDASDDFRQMIFAFNRRQVFAAAVRDPFVRTVRWRTVANTLLPGVRIGTRAVIGTGSIVTEDIPPRGVAGGSGASSLLPSGTRQGHTQQW
jgi:acetyltransferase-like isoleucine patch superfamily enzyme